MEQAAQMSQDVEARLPHGMTLERGPEASYEAYNEEAFRHFLGIERRRAERSGRSLLLLLVDIDGGPLREAALRDTVAVRVFSALNACVREVDFIGWYRASRVVGAVLTQGTGGPSPDVSQQIAKRVAEVLARRLPSQFASGIQVRVLQLQSSVKN
jgi:hypothetical protein